MKILATDLDRTLLPNGSWPPDPGAIDLFNELTEKHDVLDVYVTGRNLALTQKAIKEYGADIVIASSISFEKDQERYKTFHEDERPAGDDAGKDRKTGIHMGLFKNKLRGDNPKAASVQFIIDTSFNIMQKEMTKKYEEIIRGSINEIIEEFSCRKIRGEFVIIIKGCSKICQNNTKNPYQIG